MEKAHNSRFLAPLGFLGFLGFLGLPGPSPLPFLSLLSFGSLVVLIPFEKSRVKKPVDPKRRGYLGFLGMLAFLGFLWSDHLELAMLAGVAIWASVAVGRGKSA